MSMQPPKIVERMRANPEAPVTTGIVISTLLLTALAVGAVQFGEHVVPSWQAGYLVWTSLLVAVEAALTRHTTQDYELRERLVFRVSEWAAILILLKIIIYLVHSPAAILTDFPLWQADLGSFFTVELIAAVGLSALVWFSARAFANDLDNLYDRGHASEWDDLGKLQNALHDIRSRLAVRVFGLGFLVILLAVLARVDPGLLERATGRPAGQQVAPVVNVLAYFALAFVLLSQTQFALQRARWNWEGVQFSPRVLANWIRYSLVFFAALAVLVFILPTHYSLGLFDTLRAAFEFFTAVVGLLVLLFSFPIGLFLSLFNLGPSTVQTPGQPIAPTPPPAVTPIPNQPAAWWGVVQSLFFWVVFLGVIYLAARFYLRQNKAFMNALSAVPVGGWLRTWSQRLSAWWRRLRGQVSRVVTAGVNRLQTRRSQQPLQPGRRSFNLKRMDPRQQIIYYYLNILEMSTQKGLSRKPSQTPYQYSQELRQQLPEAADELQDLTTTFVEARYSPHPVEARQAKAASSWWERVKNRLQSWEKHKEK